MKLVFVLVLAVWLVEHGGFDMSGMNSMMHNGF